MSFLEYLDRLLSPQEEDNIWERDMRYGRRGRGPIRQDDTPRDPYLNLPDANTTTHKDLLWQLLLEKRQRPYPPDIAGMARDPYKKHYKWMSDIPEDEYNSHNMEYRAGDPMAMPLYPKPPNYLGFLPRLAK
jgi:hypothetical protein